jgi:predicted NAD-dependent protein-ADP-ribosyltransferase YbiA (DUF1768 family)
MVSNATLNNYYCKNDDLSVTNLKNTTSQKIYNIAKYTFLTLGAVLITAAVATAIFSVTTPVIYALAATAIVSVIVGLSMAIFQPFFKHSDNSSGSEQVIYVPEFSEDPSIISLPEGKNIENGKIQSLDDSYRKEVMNHLTAFDVETRYPGKRGKDIGCKLSDVPVVQFYRDDHTPETEFLGNFHEPKNNVTISFGGKKYRFTNCESAFQAAKVWYCKDQSDKWKHSQLKKFQNFNGDQVFREIRKLTLQTHDEWHKGLKQKIMYHIVKAKFIQNPDIAKKLVDIKAKYLVENTGNIPRSGYPSTWAITSKGSLVGQGENLLGVILESLKESLDVRQVAYPIVGGPLDIMDKNRKFDAHKHILYRSAINHYHKLDLQPSYTTSRISKEDLGQFILSKSKKPSYFSVPLAKNLKDYKLQTKFHQELFNYKGGENAFTLDFANQYLGGGALGKGFVQEEVMCTEFPELTNHITRNLETSGRYAGYCKELTRYRGDGMTSASKIKQGSPNPLIFKNLHRVQKIKGVYGHNLYAVNTSNLLENHVNLLPEPQKANLLAVAAANLSKSFPEAIINKLTTHTALTEQEDDTVLQIQTSIDAVEDYYNTFYAGISLANNEANGKAVINSGKLGCGVFGNHTRVALVLQMIAAQEEDVELHLFGVTHKEQVLIEDDFKAVIEEAKTRGNISTIEDLLQVVSEIMYHRLK